MNENEVISKEPEPVGDSPVNLGSVIDTSVDMAIQGVGESTEIMLPGKGVRRFGHFRSDHSLRAAKKNKKKKDEKKARKRQRK